MIISESKNHLFSKIEVGSFDKKDMNEMISELKQAFNEIAKTCDFFDPAYAFINSKECTMVLLSRDDIDPNWVLPLEVYKESAKQISKQINADIEIYITENGQVQHNKI